MLALSSLFRWEDEQEKNLDQVRLSLQSSYHPFLPLSLPFGDVIRRACLAHPTNPQAHDTLRMAPKVEVLPPDFKPSSGGKKERR